MTRILQTDLARDALYTKVNQIADEKVSLSEDETITGIKTFSVSPLVPTLTGGDSSSKAASTSFVTTAYNDLETRINTKANDNAVVHIAGNETITGVKTFTSDVTISNDHPMITLRESDVVKGTNPTSEQYWGLLAKDSTNGGESTDLGAFATHLLTDGTVWTGFSAYKNTSGSIDRGSIRVYYPQSGSAYTYAPTPTDTTTTSGTQIATTGWVNTTGNNVVHLAGAETITGAKTFNNDLIYKKTSLDFSVIPNTPLYTEIRNVDVNNKETGQFRVWKDTDSSTHVDLLGRYETDSVNIYGASVGVKTYPNGDSCGYCEQNTPWAWGALVTLTSQNTGTDGYVKYSNGLIIQWMLTSNITRLGTVITFPTPFTTTNYAICFNPYKSEPLNENATTVTERTASNCKVYGKVYDGGDMNCPCFVLAIGF